MITITLNDGTSVVINDDVTYEEFEKMELNDLERQLIITRLEFISGALGGRFRPSRSYPRYRYVKSDFEESDNG